MLEPLSSLSALMPSTLTGGNGVVVPLFARSVFEVGPYAPAPGPSSSTILAGFNGTLAFDNPGVPSSVVFQSLSPGFDYLLSYQSPTHTGAHVPYPPGSVGTFGGGSLSGNVSSVSGVFAGLSNGVVALTSTSFNNVRGSINYAPSSAVNFQACLPR